MNLEGKIVKFYPNTSIDNNSQASCPALVLTDWNTETDNCVNKALNLRVFPDCGDFFVSTSVMHIEIDKGDGKDRWQMY